MTHTSNPGNESNEHTEAWVNNVMEWLRTGRGMEDDRDQADQVTPLQPPDDIHWSIALAPPLLQFLNDSPVVAPPNSEAIAEGVESPESEVRVRLGILMKHYPLWLLRVLHDAAVEELEHIDYVVAEQVVGLYRKLYAWQLPAIEGPLLQCLSWNRREKAVAFLIELLVHLPPHDWSATAIAISPLMRFRDWKVDWVFPRLLDALHHPTTIAPVLDLANYSYRYQIAARHPAIPQTELLRSLLGGVVSRLGVLEENPSSFGDSVERVQHVLGESVSLCVSLCDALALMNDTESIGKLNQALALSHRRVRTEAAAALARLNDQSGRKELLELAAEPSVRLRVLAYADEIGCEEEIDEQWRTPLARAESELAIWLNQPQQMGLPPTSMELIDQRTLYWPGYNEPQECFLFRYAYTFTQGELSNVGLAGPMVHSFAPDLADLPVDDIYAAFAGWCAEHEDIYEVDASYFNPAQSKEAQRLAAHLEQEGHEIQRILFLGFFVGERAVVAKTLLNDTEGIAVTDGLEVVWFPTQGRIRPLGPTEVHSIYKGRKILRTFNG